jgi:hypothetical protein
LPLPDSPAMMTGACVRASFAMMLRTSALAALSPSSASPAVYGAAPGQDNADFTSVRSCSRPTGLDVVERAGLPARQPRFRRCRGR